MENTVLVSLRRQCARSWAFAVIGLVLLPVAATTAERRPAELVTPGVVAGVSAPEAAAAKASSSVAAELANWPSDSVRRIDPKVLKLALSATNCATRSGAVTSPGTLTVIDYSRPSTEPRMWVFDLATRALLYEELVAHGQGTGANMAVNFSNQPESHQTSIGLFVTEDTYVGRNGYSLRLNGLDIGYNDRARERAIVMHGAPYVNTQITKSMGRLGRSHGCPAVREPIARELIDRVKGGNVVFSYYPDQGWLKTSKYLGGCAAAN